MLGRRIKSEKTGLIEECEAFLAGDFVKVRKARGEPVPVWAWMNLLAHGTEDELRAEACQHPRSDSWRQARSFVAGELIDLIDAGLLTLADFQRTVMVPLELDVISCPGAAHWQPGQMVSGLLRALPDTRGRQRR